YVSSAPTRRPRTSPPFPYTTLFRSEADRLADEPGAAQLRRHRQVERDGLAGGALHRPAAAGPLGDDDVVRGERHRAETLDLHLGGAGAQRLDEGRRVRGGDRLGDLRGVLGVALAQLAEVGLHLVLHEVPADRGELLEAEDVELLRDLRAELAGQPGPAGG